MGNGQEVVPRQGLTPPFLSEKIFRFYPPYQIRNQNEIGPVLQECANIFETYLVSNPEQWFFWDDAAVFW